jgi:hypothetical protein
MLLLSLLLPELSRRGGVAIFFNKVMAEDLFCLRRYQDLQVLLAGRGGEGENGGFLVAPATFLPGGGGSGEQLLAPGARSMVGPPFLLLWRAMVVLRKERMAISPSLDGAGRCQRVLFFELNHIGGFSAPAN